MIVLRVRIILIIFSITLFTLSFANSYSQSKEKLDVSYSIRLKELKKQAEILLSKNNYPDASLVFDTISQYYFETNNNTFRFDYLNKKIRCLEKYDLPQAKVAYRNLIYNRDFHAIHDSILVKSVLSTFLDNSKYFGTPIENYSTICYLIDSIEIPKSSSTCTNLLLKKIEICENLNFTSEVESSYLQLIKFRNDKRRLVNYVIDFATYYQGIKNFKISNVILFQTIGDPIVTESQKSVIYNLLGNNYLSLAKDNLAKCFYDTSRIIREKIKNNNDQLRVIYNNLGNYFKQNLVSDSALVYYNKALSLSFAKESVSRDIAFELNSIGNFYFDKYQYDSANYFYLKSLETKKAIVDYSSLDIIHSYYNIGLTYTKLGMRESAFNYLNSSITQNFALNKRNKIYDSPVSPLDFLFSLETLADAYYYFYNPTLLESSCFLDSCKFLYMKGISFIDSLISNSPYEAIKLDLNSQNKRIISKLLNLYLTNSAFTCTNRNDSLQVVYLFDKCHNFVLNNRLSVKSSVNQACDSILSITNEIDKLLFTNDSIENALPFSMSKIIANSKSIFGLQSKSQFLSNNRMLISNIVSQNYSDFVNDIGLQDTSIKLEYTFIGCRLFCLYNKGNSFEWFYIGDTTIINPLIKDCIHNLRTFEYNRDLTKSLSEILLKPLLDIYPINTDLKLILDGSLLSLPFDILPYQQKDQNNVSPKYLLNYFNISYQNNLLTRHLEDLKENKQYKFLGFAPERFSQDLVLDLMDLPYSSKEINYISSLFKSKEFACLEFYNSDANFDNFSKYFGKSEILHIATHSDPSSFVELNDFLLYLNGSSNSLTKIGYFDILANKSHPELVVLATCSSFKGKHFDGEGIINLSRAFFLCGTENVIYTLFNVDEKFSSEFMISFYNNLILLKNPVLALNTTKRQFMNTKLYSNSFFWSNFNIITQ